MKRLTRAILASSSHDTLRKPHTAKKALPEIKSTAKGRVSPFPDLKRTTKTTELPKRTGKRKVETITSPHTKRQKIAETESAIPKADTARPETPTKTTRIAQGRAVMPQFQTLPETPTRKTNKKADEEVYETQEGDSDHDPQPMAIHSSRTRRMKSKITRPTSQIARTPKESLAEKTAYVDDTPSKPPKVEATQMIANKAAMQDGEQQKDKHVAANDKLDQDPGAPEEYMLISKADYLTLMRRTVVVNKMVMTFIESSSDMEDTNRDKESSARTYLLAEARSLSLGVQSLTNAITKLPTKTEQNDGSAEQVPIEKKASFEKNSLLTTEDPTAAKEDSAPAKKGADGPEEDVILVKPIPIKSPGESKERACVKVPNPTKIVVRVGKKIERE
ncbi:hypothetical protein ColTof4_03563 [Colletotrichum tofieldiae]|uniref:Uncharacterized protein n=1 Tax=Colletotrichum tofieldiae TaxID=708197 RepID=A0A166T6T9_9PEZI|nr:hypothetical protein CT0861_07347 [Colletotrichum tofieldiae]GKT65675.1 hypothetical protein ColTof3_13014 [Colletotrichum tofieldiae]GKT71140.1 hypothetical protein ColTof4_03563 [Colletotrichum tofieldiae]